MSLKNDLKKEIGKKFEELINYTKEVGAKENLKEEDIKNTINEINNSKNALFSLLDTRKLEKSEIKNLNDEEKDKFIDYYYENNKKKVGKKFFKDILEDCDYNYEETIKAITIELKKKK